MSGTRREGSQPLLRSALIALGAGGGLMIGGCALLGAAPASAQSLLSANPHAGVPVPVAHHGATVSHPTRVKGAVHGHHPAIPHGQAGRAIPPGHVSAAAAPGVARAAAIPATMPAPMSAPMPAGPAPSGVASAAAAPAGPVAAVTSPGKSHGAGVHASALTAPGGARALAKGRNKAATSAKKAHSTSSRATPASARTAKKAKGQTTPRPAPQPTPLAVVAMLAPPERLSLAPYNPFVLVPAVTGPGPSRLPVPGAPVPTISLNPFHVPLNIPRGWEGQTLRESAKLRVPLALLAAMALFMLVQSLVDRRDPKLSRAPQRQGEDSIGFR